MVCEFEQGAHLEVSQFEFGIEFGLGIRRVVSLALASRLLPLEHYRLQGGNEDLLGCLPDAAFNGDQVLVWPVDAMRAAVPVQAHPPPKHPTSAQLVAGCIMHPDERTPVKDPRELGFHLVEHFVGGLALCKGASSGSILEPSAGQGYQVPLRV